MRGVWPRSTRTSRAKAPWLRRGAASAAESRAFVWQLPVLIQTLGMVLGIIRRLRKHRSVEQRELWSDERVALAHPGARHEPSEAPQGFGLRQSSGAFDRRTRVPKAPEDWRSPRRCRDKGSANRFRPTMRAPNGRRLCQHFRLTPRDPRISSCPWPQTNRNHSTPATHRGKSPSLRFSARQSCANSNWLFPFPSSPDFLSCQPARPRLNRLRQRICIPGLPATMKRARRRRNRNCASSPWK